MKKYNNKCRTKTLLMLQKELKEFININIKYKNSFFWTPHLNAFARHASEFNNNFSFIFNDDIYILNFKLDISCNNYYFSKKISVNSEKKDIRAIKKVLKNIQIILDKRGK